MSAEKVSFKLGKALLRFLTKTLEEFHGHLFFPKGNFDNHFVGIKQLTMVFYRILMGIPVKNEFTGMWGRSYSRQTPIRPYQIG